MATFDTIRLSDELRDAGIPEHRARNLARSIADMIDGGMPTKGDLRDFGQQTSRRITWGLILLALLGLVYVEIRLAPDSVAISLLDTVPRTCQSDVSPSL